MLFAHTCVGPSGHYLHHPAIRAYKKAQPGPNCNIDVIAGKDGPVDAVKGSVWMLLWSLDPVA